MAEKPLYEDKQFRIDYLANSGEDHYITVKLSEKERHSCILERFVLREMAKKTSEMFESTLRTVDDIFLNILKKKNIGIDKLHIAICQAYIEEKDRSNRFNSNF